MHPELFTIGGFTIHTYGFMIMIGAAMGYFYLSTTVKRDLGIPADKIQNLAILLILAAFVGGKLFFYFEKPSYYFHPPSNMLKGLRTGFVFYGSLLFVIPTTIWYFRKQKWPVWPMMDRVAITACIVHIFGRMGCFFAGCCHGSPTDSIFGITFTDPASQADPLNTPLHPTQLYEILMISIILLILIQLMRHKKFDGQVFLSYIVMYAIGRSIIEIFRGDVRRGFIIENVLSHSQFISLGVIALAVAGYFYLKKKAK
ncbi:MAG: phosphatidylglycerol:prolipoprotein diacylglycerol transferase [Flavobacteriaceae bacterium]|jgi:phosphatidylglycerol:prolipoprotein diacylglycerol transferase